MTKAEKTKQFIIEKTAPIFNTKGFAGTSLSDITEATGLTKGSIYGNFSNKDEIALAALDHNLAKVNKIFKEEMAKHSAIKDKLLAYATVYEHFLKHSFPLGGCPMLNTTVDADYTHPALKKKASSAILSWKNSLVKLIEAGIDNKEFGAGVAPEQVALTLIAMIEGSILIHKATGKQNYGKLIMQSVEKLINDL